MNLELYSLRVLCQVIEDRTFSAAAKSLRVSQPTISQQIAKLESHLKVKLFQRVGREVLPTPQATELFHFAQPLLEQVESIEEKIRQGVTSPSGLVKYAMPESCQWTPHFRKVMEKSAEFPEIQLRIGVLPNEDIVQLLLKGEIDFGFVVGERLSPELRFEKYCEEYYSAVTLKEPSSLTDFRLVTYPGWEIFFTTWAKGKGFWSKLKSRMKEPCVHIGTLAGAIHAAQEGAGVAIIPTHCVSMELEKKKLIEWQGKGPRPSNPVYIARRLGEKLPQRVELIIDLLRKSHAGEI
jgi:LysR family transcriptional regulator, transcriptional activator of the cysJI operon